MDEACSKETSEPFFIIYQALTMELELLQLLHTNVTLPHSFGQHVTCITLIRYLAFGQISAVSTAHCLSAFIYNILKTTIGMNA